MYSQGGPPVVIAAHYPDSSSIGQLIGVQQSNLDQRAWQLNCLHIVVTCAVVALK